MNTKEILGQRAKNQCELCLSNELLKIYEVPPFQDERPEQCALICEKCFEQVSSSDPLDPKYWHCLKKTMWNEHPPVQVLIWRIFSRLQDNDWAKELQEQIYLEDEVLHWAQSQEEEKISQTKDSHGVILQNGDSVTLIKDLVVKGANFTAKRGTLVKKIMLTPDPDQIEAKVNGTQIVLLTKFLKKSS